MTGAGLKTARCRGCGALIQRLCTTNGELWEDRRGAVVCVKVRVEDICHGQRPDYVFHQPMPEGLRGSPRCAGRAGS